MNTPYNFLLALILSICYCTTALAGQYVRVSPDLELYYEEAGSGRPLIFVTGRLAGLRREVIGGGGRRILSMARTHYFALVESRSARTGERVRLPVDQPTAVGNTWSASAITPQFSAR